MVFNEKQYLGIVEHKRNNVINIVESDYAGSSETNIPALFLIGTASEIAAQWGMEMVVHLDSLCDMFLNGYGIGTRKGKEINEKLGF